eukprot:6179295-Pleurochrysis_carterae.AAC.3
MDPDRVVHLDSFYQYLFRDSFISLTPYTRVDSPEATATELCVAWLSSCSGRFRLQTALSRLSQRTCCMRSRGRRSRSTSAGEKREVTLGPRPCVGWTRRRISAHARTQMQTDTDGKSGRRAG